MSPWPGLAGFARQVSLPTSGLKLFYFAAGQPEAPPAVLLHGLGDEADTWRHILPRLAERYRVAAFDLPGFGRSDPSPKGYSLPFFQDILLEFVDAAGMERPLVAGHSLGALIAHSTALRAPERFGRLALIAGGLAVRSQKLDLLSLAFLVPGLGEFLYQRLSKDPQAAYQSLQPYYANLDGMPADERAFLFERVNQRVTSGKQRRAFLGTLRSLAGWITRQQKGLGERLRDFNLPTTIAWGQADRVNPPVNCEYLAQLQPSARLVLLPGAGHNLQQESPQELLAQLL
jgi:pimeloyl-ACP methyl ester carboxylesterase